MDRRDFMKRMAGATALPGIAGARGKPLRAAAETPTARPSSPNKLYYGPFFFGNILAGRIVVPESQESLLELDVVLSPLGVEYAVETGKGWPRDHFIIKGPMTSAVRSPLASGILVPLRVELRPDGSAEPTTLRFLFLESRKVPS